jgi:phosphoglycerol transferase MdoB-like AlkP superfamily enzyme
MSKFAVDLVGWIGAGLLLIAYGLVSFKKLRADSGYYQLLNVVGSCLLIVNTIYYRAYPSAVVNLIWIIIALVAAYRLRSSAASG